MYQQSCVLCEGSIVSGIAMIKISHLFFPLYVRNIAMLWQDSMGCLALFPTPFLLCFPSSRSSSSHLPPFYLRCPSVCIWHVVAFLQTVICLSSLNPSSSFTLFIFVTQVSLLPSLFLCLHLIVFLPPSYFRPSHALQGEHTLSHGSHFVLLSNHTPKFRLCVKMTYIPPTKLVM